MDCDRFAYPLLPPPKILLLEISCPQEQFFTWHDQEERGEKVTLYRKKSFHPWKYFNGFKPLKCGFNGFHETYRQKSMSSTTAQKGILFIKETISSPKTTYNTAALNILNVSQHTIILSQTICPNNKETDYKPQALNITPQSQLTNLEPVLSQTPCQKQATLQLHSHFKSADPERKASVIGIALFIWHTNRRKVILLYRKVHPDLKGFVNIQSTSKLCLIRRRRNESELC